MKYKTCGYEFDLNKDNHYVARNNITSGLSTIVNNDEVGLFDAFDCPKCGCQNLMQDRKRMIKQDKIELEKNDQSIKINRVVKNILENLNKKYRWIAKDRNGNVCIFVKKPEKDSVYHAWDDGEESYKNLSEFFKSELFDFLSWNDKEPTNIKNLLGNYEVIDNVE